MPCWRRSEGLAEAGMVGLEVAAIEAALDAWTLAGVEATAMLAKGQVRGVPATDRPARCSFVHRAFGLAA